MNFPGFPKMERVLDAALALLCAAMLAMLLSSIARLKACLSP